MLTKDGFKEIVPPVESLNNGASVVFINHKCVPTIHFIGGGIMGLTAAIQVAEQAHMQGLKCRVRVYESGAFGGGKDEWAASPRCQLWLHTDGQLYAKSQPAVALELQMSTRWLQEVAPFAFNFPPAWSIEQNDDNEASLSDYFEVLGIPYHSVSLGVFRYWYPELRLPNDCRVYRVTDGTINIRRLGSSLMMKAQALGVELVFDKIEDLSLKGSTVHSIKTADQGLIEVASDDQVVLACGSRIRPLLAAAGIVVPGLRLFQSHLVATDAFGLNALFVMHGVTNCVPHFLNNGSLINIFGNGHRIEIPAEADNQKPRVDPQVVEIVCQEVEKEFGLKIPKDNRMAWLGIKTEIVPETEKRRQAYHIGLAPGLSNTWLAIPGKLSQAAACASELSKKLLDRWTDEPLVTRPIWETLKTAR